MAVRSFRDCSFPFFTFPTGAVVVSAPFGVAPERCHRYDLSAVRGRALQEFDYHCSCRGHRLSSIRHNRVLAGGSYICRRCATALRLGLHPGGGCDEN